VEKNIFFERAGGVWEVYGRRMGNPNLGRKKKYENIEPNRNENARQYSFTKAMPKKNIRKRALPKTTEISSDQTKSIALNA